MRTIRDAGVTALMGALELKRCYHRNLFIAVLIILGATALMLLVTTMLASAAPPAGPEPRTVALTDTFTIDLSLPPPTVETPSEVVPALPPTLPDQVIIDVCEFDVVSDTVPIPLDPVMASQEEISRQIGSGGNDGGSLWGSDQAGVALRFVPPPDTFIAIEVRPQAIDLVSPRYPSIAKRAGIEGTVWVKVLIDFDGSVMDAIILHESGANAGFEEAALESARLGKWSPGLQNKQPVRVWVAYEIKFRLR